MAAERSFEIRRAAHGKRKALSARCDSLASARVVARNRLLEAAEIVEFDVLPLGCEAIRRVGKIFPSGVVKWRRERRRPAMRYLSDLL